MLYFISVMITEDISCLRSAYLLQLLVKTLNETAIYHINILAQHERAPNTFYKILNIPLKIEMMITYCVEINLNLESLSNCNFLTEIFFSYFIYNFVGKFDTKQRKTKDIISTLFYVIKSLELLISI